MVLAKRPASAAMQAAGAEIDRSTLTTEITIGPLAAQMLYGIGCPVVAIEDQAEWRRLSVLLRLAVAAGAVKVVITPPQ